MTKRKTPGSEQAAALTWFATQPRPIQVEAIKLQTDLVRQARQPGTKPSSEFYLDKLAEASMRMRYEDDSLRMKASMSQSEAKKVHDRKIARFKASRAGWKSSPKREAIRLKYYHLVQELRQKEHFGWRNCAAYLSEQHQFDVTHAYLREVVEALEKLENGD
jgi:hypothetical protein